MYFVYCATTDIARPRLFTDDTEVSDWWSVSQATIKSSESDACEEVEVMPYFCNGKTEVMFTSKADRLQMLITGPRSLDEAMRKSDQRDSLYN